MVLYDGLDTLLLSASTPRIDFVFVHGLGLGPETTWHDDASGKNWIEEPDFVLGLGWRARVMSFRYNSDIASNMSAASIAIHSSDLLYHLEKALAKSDNIGLIFIAHGLGGVIVKKALRFCELVTNCPRVRDATTGVVFLGTPHTDTNSEALLQTVRNTVQLLRHDHHTIDDDDIRHFASAVASINSTFIKTKPKALQTVSYWEEKASTWMSADGEECSELVVPKNCKKAELWNNLDISMDCTYLTMPSFPTVFDSRFTAFNSDFSALVHRVLEHKSVVIQPLKLSSAQSATNGSKASSTRKRGRRTRSARARSARSGMDTDGSGAEDELFSSWQKRKKYEEDRTQLGSFLQSLQGWSNENTGHDIFVASGTCEWILLSNALNIWLDFVTHGSFFWLAAPGSGKTHVAKALATHLEKTNPNDVVLSFHCMKQETKPHVWDYFTWALLQARPSWFSLIPKGYQGRSSQSERLGLGDFVDIWNSLRQYGDHDTKEAIWLVIDGLEACGDEAFLDFWQSLEQLRKRQADSKSALAVLKVLFTGTLTPAMTAVGGGVSRYLVSGDLIKQDIALCVDTRLNKCIDGDSLLDIKSNVEALRQEIKDTAGDYWPFARHAITEVELAMGRNLQKVASFKSRLPVKLEAHVQQTLLSLRQSVGPQRFLYPLFRILLANNMGPELNIYELKDALYCLYGAEEIRKLDLADLIVRHGGGLLAWTASGSLYFRHSGFVQSLNRDIPDKQCKANLAYLCLSYLLQDCFKTMPDPSKFTDPLKWLRQAHPFYSYAVWNCLDFIAESGTEEDQLTELFIRFFIQRPPQYKVSREWLAVMPGFDSQNQEFEDLSIATAIWDERLVPLIERVFPPPLDFSGLPRLQRVRVQWAAWNRGQDKRQPCISLPQGWLSARSDCDHTPLLGAARRGNIAAVKYILKWRPNINERGGPAMRSILMMLYCSSSCGTSEQRPACLTAITADLFKLGANLNLSDPRGSTPLHVACDQASLSLISMLLDLGASVNISDEDGCTAWQIACEGCSIDVLRELVARGVEVDSLFDTGETALTYIISCGWLDKLRVLLPAADVNLLNSKGVAPIHKAVQTESSRYEILDLLISQPAIDLDLAQSRILRDHNPETSTALLIAITNKDHRAAEMLLGAGATSGHVPGLSVLPLELAVRQGDRDMAEILLRHRAPVNAFLVNSRKTTALSIAAAACDVDMLKLLLDNGADPTVDDGLLLPNAARLVMLSASPDIEAMKLLLGCSNPPDIVCNNALVEKVHKKQYSSIFLDACQLKETHFVQLLLDHGVEISSWLEMPGICSPLHAAVQAGSLEVCRLLLELEPRFLNFFCRSEEDSYSPLHSACHFGRVDIVKDLLEKGADVKLLTPQREQSCLLVACIHGNLDTVKAVLAADTAMANVGCYVGRSPLQVVSYSGQVQLLEELLKSGASMSKCHAGRHPSISRTLFRRLGGRSIPLLRAYMKHGLDINAPFESFGHSTFSIALEAAPEAVVSWMIDRGGDLVRTQRLSKEHEIWEYGLRSVRKDLSPRVLEALVTANRKVLTETDWSGQNALGDFSLGWRSYLARVYWLCEDILTESSQDIFSEMMLKPDIFGLSPVDRSMGITGCLPEARCDVARLAVEFIDFYLEKPEGPLLRAIEYLVVKSLEYTVAEDIGPVLTLRYSCPGIQTLPGGQGEIKASMAGPCQICGKSAFEEASFCVRCRRNSCVACGESDEGETCTGSEKHSRVRYVLDVEVTADSDGVQAAFRRIRGALLSIADEQSQDRLSESSTAVSGKEEANEKARQLQVSLQLAALHAFNMLAIRRPIGAVYLPLSVRALETISPFEKNIADMRRVHERKMLDAEITQDRRVEEMRYMNSGMGRLAYADEELHRHDMVLTEIAGLFSEPGRS